MILMVLVLHLLLPVVNEAQGNDYDYPFTNPLAATVVGTPNAYKADLPQCNYFEILMFLHMKIPKTLVFPHHFYSWVFQISSPNGRRRH